jgi:bacillithiol biosynthesis cysteine-adding enzyme BshC
MPSDCVSYQDSGYFAPLVVDYLNQKPELEGFYHRFPSFENFEKQCMEKQSQFTNRSRKILISALEKQYKSTATSIATKENIAKLLHDNTFTITTGHQLNLFSGPLYFLYKIISTINLTRELKAKYPLRNFVPIYWMATEDHDFEEINYFTFKGKKICWNKASSGPVGRLSTAGIEAVLEIFKKELGTSQNADYIKKLFHDAYINHTNLAAATRFLANELFGEYGLVILDGDDRELKGAFAPYMKEELLFQKSYQEVQSTISKMKSYDIQVNPREINLFYIEDDLRERIVFEDGYYQIKNTALQYKEEEILVLLEKNPEQFSPNVLLRPLYQEVLLPNLCYIGGGGELAYWLELKSFFNAVDVPFPILLLRNSALLTTAKQAAKADNLGLTWQHLFQKQWELTAAKTREISEFPIDLSNQREQLKNQFQQLHLLAKQTDKSFIGAVKAQETKQLKGLDHLEKRLLKAQKRKYQIELNRIVSLQNDLFPNEGLQERVVNFSEFYIEFGNGIIDQLMTQLQPLKNKFTIITLP